MQSSISTVRPLLRQTAAAPTPSFGQGPSVARILPHRQQSSRCDLKAAYLTNHEPEAKVNVVMQAVGCCSRLMCAATIWLLPRQSWRLLASCCTRPASLAVRCTNGGGGGNMPPGDDGHKSSGRRPAAMPLASVSSLLAKVNQSLGVQPLRDIRQVRTVKKVTCFHQPVDRCHKRCSIVCQVCMYQHRR